MDGASRFQRAPSPHHTGPASDRHAMAAVPALHASAAAVPALQASTAVQALRTSGGRAPHSSAAVQAPHHTCCSTSTTYLATRTSTAIAALHTPRQGTRLLLQTPSSHNCMQSHHSFAGALCHPHICQAAALTCAATLCHHRTTLSQTVMHALCEAAGRVCLIGTLPGPSLVHGSHHTPCRCHLSENCLRVADCTALATTERKVRTCRVKVKRTWPGEGQCTMQSTVGVAGAALVSTRCCMPTQQLLLEQAATPC